MAYQSDRTGSEVDASLDLADSALQTADINTLAELNAILSDATLDDSSDARTPSAHAASHATGQSDAIAPADIGAATSAQGALADTALQPADIDTLAELNAIVADATLGDFTTLATVATSGDYDDLSNKPTLGTAAAEDVGAFEPAGVAAADITDSTAVGRSVLTAADQAAGRTAIDAEQSGAASSAISTHESTYTHSLIATALQPDDTLNADTIRDADVASDTLADGDILVYRTGTGDWELEAKPEGGGGYTDEEAQDAVGNYWTDTTTIDFTYTDSTPEFKADVIPGGIKLDDLGSPDDNTDLNASTGAHGLLPKLGGGTTNFLRADGTWAEPPGGSGYTDEDAQDAVGTILSDSSSIDFTYDDETPSITAVVLPGGVNALSLQNAPAEAGATADQTGAEIEGLLDTELANTDWKKAVGTSAGTVAAGDDSRIVNAVQPADDADTLGSGGASDGQVLMADGIGGAAWETPAYYNDEAAQDAVGGILADSSSIDFTYTDETPEITAAVIPGGINALSLQNAPAEAGATADQTGAEIEGLLDTELANTDWKKSEATLNVLNMTNAPAEAGATADQTGAEIEGLLDTELSNTDWKKAVGTSAGTVAAGDDSRIVNAVQPADDADTLGSGVASDGQVLTADGIGGAAWEDAAAGYTDEEAQDAVGTILADSSTIDFTYTDETPEITAAVIPGGIKLDDLGAPDDNTDLNVTTGAHGLCPKLGGGTTNFLRADGTWADPGGGGGDNVTDGTVTTGSAAFDFTTSGASAGDALVFGGTSVSFASVAWDGDIADINLDGGTDIGADLADADLVLVDDGAGGTNRKSAISRIWTYILAKIAANNVTFNTYVEDDNTISFSATPTFPIDGRIHAITLTGNITSISTSGTAPSNSTIYLTQDGTGGRTVTWPSAWKWPDGTALTMPSTAGDVAELVLRTDPSGTVYASAAEMAVDS